MSYMYLYFEICETQVYFLISLGVGVGVGVYPFYLCPFINQLRWPTTLFLLFLNKQMCVALVCSFGATNSTYQQSDKNIYVISFICWKDITFGKYLRSK